MKLRSYLSSLTKPELEVLKEQLNLAEDEGLIFDNISKGYTLKKIECVCNMSESTIIRKQEKIYLKIKKIKEMCHMKKEIPISEKYNLTIEEAAAYFNIGTDKIREIVTENKNLSIVVGVKKLVKKKKMEEYLDKIMVV